MLERGLVWKGTGEEPPAAAGPALRVGLYDTTLRDGEQSVGVVFLPEEKAEIARRLDAAGVARIEVGFPRVSADDREAIRQIGRAGLRAELWGFSRALVADVEAVLELGLKAMVVEAPVSEWKLRAFGLSRETVLERIRAAVARAAAVGAQVAFFGVDGTRAPRDFLERAYRTAIDAGAEEAVVVDTVGVATPEAVRDLVERVRGWLGPEVPLHFHGHNDFGLATANAVAAARAGAAWIHVTVNGMGERAGNANLGETALALEALYGVETGIRFERLRELSRYVQEVGGYAVEPWKPLIGENLFRRETGSVASQFHIPEAVEPYAAEIVGARRRLVLGKKSGLDSIRLKCAELGLEVPEERFGALLEEVKALSVQKKGLVSDEEFRQLAASPRA